MLAELHKETFAECQDTEFKVLLPDSAGFGLKLTGVVGHVQTPRQEAFSVFFHGPADHFMQQGMVRLQNEKLGEIEIFLVPIGRDASGFQYEAVFNRLLPA